MLALYGSGLEAGRIAMGLTGAVGFAGHPAAASAGPSGFCDQRVDEALIDAYSFEKVR